MASLVLYILCSGTTVLESLCEKIVSINSSAGQNGRANGGQYSATKHAYGHVAWLLMSLSGIYVRSERAAQRVTRSVSVFIVQRLKLKVNASKSAVGRPQCRKFLGFSFTRGFFLSRVLY